MIKSEAIKKYFNNVYNIKNSPETTLQLISAEFTQISKELKLGYLKISTSLLSETSKLTDSILFSSEEVFEIEDDGLAAVTVEEIPEDITEDAIDAKEGCPTNAIEDAE